MNSVSFLTQWTFRKINIYWTKIYITEIEWSYIEIFLIWNRCHSIKNVHCFFYGYNLTCTLFAKSVSLEAKSEVTLENPNVCVYYVGHETSLKSHHFRNLDKKLY